MFKFKSACYFALVSLLTSSNASAGPVIIKDLKRAKSAWFYNKPGATTEDVSRDDYNCTAFGHYMFTMGPYNDGKPYGPYPGLLGSVFGDAVSSGPIRGNKDDCMMSLGYSRYNTADDSMKSFMARYENLTTEERDLYHGSDIPPEGKITRKWVNTFWITGEGEQKPDVEERNYMPERFDLSKSETLKSVEPSFRGNPSLIQPLVFKSVKKAEDIERTEGTSLVIVKVKPVNHKPAEIRFSRVNPETGEPNPILDKKRTAKIPTLVISAKHDTIKGYNIYEVPSGHYALSFARYHAMCMKTVIVEFKSEEVINLGEYTGYRNKESVHPLAPTPRVRFRFDDNDLYNSPVIDVFKGKPITAEFKNNFEMKCPAILGEKMYGVSFPGRPDF